MKMWIARNADGILFLYVNKPSLDSNDNMYYTDGDMEDDYLNIDKEFFPEVTFENSPQEVELVIKRQDEVQDLYKGRIPQVVQRKSCEANPSRRHKE